MLLYLHGLIYINNMETPRENLILESQDGMKDTPRTKVEIATQGGTTKLDVGLGVLKEALDHNKPVTIKSLEDLGGIINGSKIIIGGDVMTVEEVTSIPDLKMNMEIWQEISEDKYGKVAGMTYMTKSIARILANRGPDIIYTYSLKSISIPVAEILSGCGSFIIISGLTSISDEVAERLSKHEKGIDLSGVKSLSHKCLECLSKTKGYLVLDGLEILSDADAECLSKHKGRISLKGLSAISDNAAEFLADHKKDLYLNGLQTLSDSSARSLARHDGKVELKGLTNLSDRAVNMFATSSRYFEFGSDINDRMISARQSRYV